MTLLEHVRFEGRKPRNPTRSAPAPPPVAAGRRAAKRRYRPLTLIEEQLLAAILKPVGVDARHYRSGPMQRRLSAVLRALRCSTPEEALALVTSKEPLARKALDALVIGHTAAFRDTEVFHALRSFVLPSLKPGPLRVWSIGCSRGLELMSVAMLLAEREQLAGSCLRGSDCRLRGAVHDQALAADFLAAIPPEFAHLRLLATVQEITRWARTIEWRAEDVLSQTFNERWDVVLCRNVSIYLQPEAAGRLWNTVISALEPGGILVTGKAERPGDRTHLRRLASCIYKRNEED